MEKEDDRAQERADLIVRNAKVTTLQDGGAAADAVAVRGERIAAVGGEAEVMRLAGASTTVVDAGGRRVIPGLNDSHLHAIRGGLMFTSSCGGTGLTAWPAGWK
jgi:predicted amidohydrolase YtcJ